MFADVVKDPIFRADLHCVAVLLYTHIVDCAALVWLGGPTQPPKPLLVGFLPHDSNDILHSFLIPSVTMHFQSLLEMNPSIRRSSGLQLFHFLLAKEQLYL